jgi:uncharacterized protein
MKHGSGGNRLCYATMAKAGRALSFALLALSTAAALAQNAAPLSTSYITPFPQGDRYQVKVIGDWLGSGLASGLQDAFKGDATVQISDASRPSYGLLRAEQLDLYGEADRMLAATPPVNIVVMLLGVNDRASFRSGISRAQPGSEEWKEAYGKEAEKLTKKFRAGNAALYWVGLPPMGHPAMNEFAASVNDALRQAAYLNNAKFVETSAGFTDQLGAYAAFGPDVTGQVKRLREGDGVGLTQAGNRKLANYVEIAIRRDLAQARAQRNIPLAGDDEEQARVVPRQSQSKSPAADSALLKPSAPKEDPAAPAKTGLEPAQQDAARREQAAFGAGSSPQGEFILGDLGNGLTSIAVISPIGDLSIREVQRQTPLAERLYFKVLSKGEALPSKLGRSDDFQWSGDRPSRSQ